MPRRTATEPDIEPAAVDDTEPADVDVVDEGRVREIVSETLAALGINQDDDDTPPADATPEKPAGTRTQAAVEADVETKVRDAIGKLRGEEDRDRRLAALEERTAEPERAPIKERVSTRLMGWGRKVG